MGSESSDVQESLFSQLECPKSTSLIEFCSRSAAVASSMESESTDLEKSLLSRLECLGCKGYVVAPIIMCKIGHIVCKQCRSNSCCPYCGTSFTSVRNWALEDQARQVKYTCKYQANGCTEIFDHDMIGGHQAECRYMPQKCPVDTLGCGSCSWTGSYSDIEGHLKENHLQLCWEYVEGDFKLLFQLTAKITLICFIFAYNEIFFSVFQEGNDSFYAAVLYVGPAGNAAKYKYRVEFVNKDNTEGVTVMCLTRSYKERLPDVHSTSYCGRLDYNEVKRLVDEKCNLKFKLDIIKVGN